MTRLRPDRRGVAVILVVVMINALIGFLQEGKAERAMEAIRHMLSPSAIVLRDGQFRELAADQQAVRGEGPAVDGREPAG